MNLKSTFQDSERAVSPVIGVILMVAITVILAAVIGTFVLGLGDSVESAPQASFGFDYDDDDKTVEIQHRGGDSLDTGNLEIRVAGDDAEGDANITSVNGSIGADLPSELSAGDTVTVEGDSDLEEGDKVDIIFSSEGRDSIIGTFRVP